MPNNSSLGNWCQTIFDHLWCDCKRVYINLNLQKKIVKIQFPLWLIWLAYWGRERKYHVIMFIEVFKTPRIFSWEFSFKINWKTIKTRYIHTTGRICTNNVEVREGRVIWRQYPARWGNQVPYPLAEVLSEKASEVSAPNIWHIS